MIKLNSFEGRGLHNAVKHKDYVNYVVAIHIDKVYNSCKIKHFVTPFRNFSVTNHIFGDLSIPRGRSIEKEWAVGLKYLLNIETF